MKSTLESWFSGILTSSEIVSADRYSLFVGVLKKRFVWILLGILICQAVLPESCFTREQSIWHSHPQSLSVC